MFCSKCGTLNPEEAKFCSKCGSQLLAQAAAAPNPGPAEPHTSAQFQNAGFQPGQVNRRTSGMAIASLILGILGISLLAIIFGAIALNEIGKDPNVSGKGMAIAGLVLGILGFVVGFIVLIAIFAVA